MIAIAKGKLWSRSLQCAAMVAASIGFASVVSAQQTPDATAPPPQSADDKTKVDDKTKSDKPVAPPCDPKASDCKPDKDRIFSLVPNYSSVNEKKLPPLTVGGKFKLAAKGAFDPGEFILIGVLATYDQITDDPKSLHEGWGAFGERYALNFSDQTIGSFMTGAIFPSLLHQDPRYYRRGSGGFWHRAGYAVGRTVFIRSDSGRNQFNASELVGNGVAAGIANAYHPHDERSLTGTAATWGTDVAVDTMANVFKEFWPDISKKIHWHQINY